MQHEASIRQELDELARLLEARRHLPAAYSRALQDSAWLRSQVAAGGPLSSPNSGRSRWVPAVAAASMVAGLVTAPPGYALPSPQLPSFIGAGVDIPPPPVLLAPNSAWAVPPSEDGALARNRRPEPTFASASAQGAPPSELGSLASQPQPEARQIAPVPATAPDVPAAGVPESAEPVPDRGLELPFATEEIRPEPSVRAAPAAEASPAKKARAKRGRTVIAPADRRLEAPLRRHTIKPGETLIKLARKYYQGAGAHWKGIFAVNKTRVRDADKIFPGDQIIIPSLAEAVAAERGRVPILAAAPAGGLRVKNSGQSRRAFRPRHKTRLAHRDPILRPRPGLPI